MPRSRRIRTARTMALTGLVLALIGISSACAPTSPAPEASASPEAPEVLVSSSAHTTALGAGSRLLVHEMPGVTGGTTRATTQLFVPRGQAPDGGWPIIAWAHGTSTPGDPTCAPSETPDDLDGGLTRDGFVSDYAWQLGELVDAGYAVVAPDLEGLGPEGTDPVPYFSLESTAQSLIAGVRAAREAEPTLSNQWVAMGHSEGAHGVLGVESRADDAPELEFEGTAALAPFASIEEQVEIFGGREDVPGVAVNRATEQFNVALMAVGLMATDPTFDPHEIMGEDLAGLLPQFLDECSVKAIDIIGQAVAAEAPEDFDGAMADWAQHPKMKKFLEENDPAVTPGFTLRRPTLITQGTADVFVLKPLTDALVGDLRDSGTPVTYETYRGADHFTVIREGNAEVLDFLAERFAGSSDEA